MLIEYCGLTILIDAGPDFRSQMLAADVGHLDAILLTHNHKDHTAGLDDVRAFNYVDKKIVELFCEERVLKSLQKEYSYAFEEFKYPGAPEWRVHIIDDKPFIVYPNRGGELVWNREVGYGQILDDGSFAPTDKNNVMTADRPTAENLDKGGVEIIPIRGLHDRMPVLGFRFGDIAYITDMSSISDSELIKLQGLKHLTLNTVGRLKHHSHFSLGEATALARRIGAEHTWLTHLSHSFPQHEQFCRELPEGIAPAYDGLIIED